MEATAVTEKSIQESCRCADRLRYGKTAIICYTKADLEERGGS
jgi:hypothetical protein